MKPPFKRLEDLIIPPAIMRQLRAENPHGGDVEIANFKPGGDIEDAVAGEHPIAAWSVYRDTYEPYETVSHLIRPLTNAEIIAVLRATIEGLKATIHRDADYTQIGRLVVGAVKRGEVK